MRLRRLRAGGSVVNHLFPHLSSYLVDELSLWGVSLGNYYIQADSSMALGGIEPGFVQLSCIKCTRLQAEEGCMEMYHLCTREELLSGVFAVADINGWLSYNVSVWEGATRNSIITDFDLHQTHLDDRSRSTEIDPEDIGVGVCCKD